MKKVVLATFLTCAVASCLPLASAQGASPGAQAAPAPVAAPAAAPAADPCAVPPMAAAEYAVYTNANTQTDPKAKAGALEQYLTQFPQSAMKVFTLETLMALYGNPPISDAAKTLDAADRLLQVAPNDLTALAVEAGIRKGQADPITDATAKQAGYDSAASYAQKGLAATKPQCTPDADFNKLKANYYPTFYSIVGYAAFSKKDTATAIDAYKKELAFVPLDATKAVGQPLQDTFYLGEAYRFATPPDYLNCAFYESRAIAYAPANFQAIMAPTAKYCYHKYHGPNDDQYAQLGTIAAANLNPPADLGTTIKPAPTPADIATQVIATTPDLGTLAPGDKEFILQYGTPDQAAKVWGIVKGKSFQFDNVLVIASTPTQVQVAISDDAVQGKTADFTFNLTPPENIPELKVGATAVQKAAYNKKVAAAKKLADDIAAATQPGKNVTLTGMYDSFTPSPIMITMKDGVVVLVLPKATPAKPAPKPAARPAARKPAAR